MTSGLVRRKRTGAAAGTRTHCGTNTYCSARMRTVIEPSGSTAVPRLLSTNSPCRCKVAGLMVSTSLRGFIICVRPVNTTTASIKPRTVAMVKSQRRSVRSTTSSRTSPDEPSLLSCSANGPPRQEQHEIEEQPANEQESYSGGSYHDRPADRKSTRLNSSHQITSYAFFCFPKKNPHTALT